VGSGAPLDKTAHVWHPKCMMKPAARTKRVKAALRTNRIEILSCYSEQPEWTQLRVYNRVREDAITALNAAGFNDIRSAGNGPFVTELSIWA
jgi:hypothetical protein